MSLLLPPMTLETATKVVDASRALLRPSPEIIYAATDALGPVAGALRAKLVDGDMLCLQSSAADAPAERLVYEVSECLVQHHGDVLLPYTFLRLAFPTEESWVEARDMFFHGMREDQAISLRDVVRTLTNPGTMSSRSSGNHDMADKQMRRAARSIVSGEPNDGAGLFKSARRGFMSLSLVVLFFVVVSLAAPGMARATARLSLELLGRLSEPVQAGTTIYNVLARSEVVDDDLNLVPAMKHKDSTREEQLTALSLLSLKCRLGEEGRCSEKVTQAFEKYIGLDTGGSATYSTGCKYGDWGVGETRVVETRMGHPLIGKTIRTNIPGYDPMDVERTAISSLDTMRNLLRPELWEELEERIHACGGLDLSVHQSNLLEDKYSARAGLGTVSIEVTSFHTENREIMVHEMTHLTQAPSDKVRIHQDYIKRRNLEESVYASIVTSTEFTDYVGWGSPVPYGATNPREMGSEYAAMLHELFYRDGPMISSKHRMFLQDWFLDKIEPYHNSMYQIPMSVVRERAQRARTGELLPMDLVMVLFLIYWLFK